MNNSEIFISSSIFIHSALQLQNNYYHKWQSFYIPVETLGLQVGGIEAEEEARVKLEVAIKIQVNHLTKFLELKIKVKSQDQIPAIFCTWNPD